jgi:hypothetical protein
MDNRSKVVEEVHNNRDEDREFSSSSFVVCGGVSVRARGTALTRARTLSGP